MMGPSPTPRRPPMSEKNTEPNYGTLIEGHTYDGIQEYDNPMPKWWLYLFYLTIAWGVFYLVGINVGWIDTYQDTLAKENSRIDALVAAAAEASPEITPEFLQQVVASGEHLDTGKAAFATFCASCHGQNGEGMVGPNLTDSAWIHGGTLTDIYVVADKGVLDKGMPAWGAILKAEQMLGIVTYIDSIRDTNIPGGKEAQGTPMESADPPPEAAGEPDPQAGPNGLENPDATEQGTEDSDSLPAA